MTDQAHIRNFCIIAHIDHGKSTLADRLLETTGTVKREGHQEQMLDKMDLERERGITIKTAAVRMRYQAKDRQEYDLHLIDTPSHFDSYIGIVAYVRVVDGSLKPGQKVRMMSTGREIEITGVGVFGPDMRPTQGLDTGQVGFFHAGIKSIGECRVGDTLTAAGHG